jgi:hypothetical protein
MLSVQHSIVVLGVHVEHDLHVVCGRCVVLGLRWQ